MGLGLDHAADEEGREPGGRIDHLIDLEADRRQTLGDLLERGFGL